MLDDDWRGASSTHRAELSGKALSQEEATAIIEREGRMFSAKLTLALDEGEAKELSRFESELTPDGVRLSGVNEQLQQAKFQWVMGWTLPITASMRQTEIENYSYLRSVHHESYHYFYRSGKECLPSIRDDRARSVSV